MKFNHLSGDFAAQYNEALRSYKKEQEKLDKKYDEKINSLVLIEKNRLKESFGSPFEVGSMVKTEKGKIGKVLQCPVELSVYSTDEYECSVLRYYPLDSSDCESVLTVEGNMKKVVVAFPANELEKDWGHETIVSEFWADELEKA